MNWLLVCHRSEVANPGDYVRLPLPTGDIVAFNDGGTVVAIDGVCPHRGARIFPGLHGNSRGVCPYHGWTFRDGQMNKPNAQAYPAVVRGMRHTAIEWIGDWLFAFSDMHYQCGEFYRWEIEGFRQFLIDTAAMIDGRHDFGEMRINCDWHMAVENALEDMHIPLVHQDTFAPLKMSRVAQYRIQNNSMAVYELGDARTIKTIDKVGKYLQYATGPRYFHLFLNPHAAISSVGGITYSVQHYLPQADGSTLFLTRLYKGKTKPGAPDLSAFYDATADFNAKVFKQDADLTEQVVGKGYALASPDEDRVKWFREANP